MKYVCLEGSSEGPDGSRMEGRFMALGRQMELGWCHFEAAVGRFGGVGVGLARGGRPPVAPMGDAENINFLLVL